MAHPVRIYDYWLGGENNFPVDRAAGDQMIALRPEIIPAVRANRTLDKGQPVALMFLTTPQYSPAGS